jgi:SAM-dependent methyltransferase
MTGPDPAEDARRLAADSLAAEDATGWFDRLYSAAEHGDAVIPWDRGAPRGLLVQWARERGLEGGGRRALVVGCGLGADAEYAAGLGFETVAFDIAPAAIRMARRRFPGSRVDYVVADLLDPPGDWSQAFDLVVESITVQALPEPPRARAIAAVADMVARGGELIVIAAARDEADGPAHGPPWPLTRADVEAFATGGVEPVRIERAADPDNPSGGRWLAHFRRLG